MQKINLMIELTNRCNLLCPTCFSHQDNRKKRDIKLTEFKKLVVENRRILNELSLYNYGEPLLNKNIYKMIRFAKTIGVRHIKIATNGTLLDNNNVNNILHSGLDYISISLDGATKEVYDKFRKNGNFKKVVSNISNLVRSRNILKKELKIELQFIIMKHNVHQVKSIKKLANDLKVDFLRLKLVLIKRKKWRYLLPKQSLFNRYANNKNITTCYKPKKEIVINSDGTALPCCYIVGKDIERFNLGNAFSQKLENIMHSKKYTDFIKNCSTDKSKNSCCQDCNEGNTTLDYQFIKIND